jgi:hypothetical protein
MMGSGGALGLVGLSIFGEDGVGGLGAGDGAVGAGADWDVGSETPG